MSLSRGAVSWDDNSTPKVGRVNETPAPIYMSTPYEGQGAWGGRDASPGGWMEGVAREKRPEYYVDATDARIVQLEELLASERRVTKVLTHYSKVNLDGVADRDLEVKDMEIDPSMPVLETMEMEGRNTRINADEECNEVGDRREVKTGPERADSEGNNGMGIHCGIDQTEVRTEGGGGDGKDTREAEKVAPVASTVDAARPAMVPPARGGMAPRMKPSTYDGLTPYEDYRVQFNMLAELNEWSEKIKALYLAGSLSKGARSVLNDMLPEDRYSYTKLDGALRVRYGTDDQSELFKAKLRGRIKSKEESLQELAHDIRRLVRLAYPKAAMSTHDDLTKDQFIESLGDGEIRWSVFQARPKNITEALKVAMELEAFRESEKCRMRKSVRGVHVEEVKIHEYVAETDAGDRTDETVVKLETSMKQMIAQIEQLRQGNRRREIGGKPGDGPQEAGRREGRTNKEEPPVRGGDESYGTRRPFDIGRVKCFRCDKFGHYVRDCPELPRRGGMQEEKKGLNE
jgi:hypothetical protein